MLTKKLKIYFFLLSFNIILCYAIFFFCLFNITTLLRCMLFDRLLVFKIRVKSVVFEVFNKSLKSPAYNNMFLFVLLHVIFGANNCHSGTWEKVHACANFHVWMLQSRKKLVCDSMCIFCVTFRSWNVLIICVGSAIFQHQCFFIKTIVTGQNQFFTAAAQLRYRPIQSVRGKIRPT